ncbi:MAG: hypothetical protein QNK05_25295 [Myxococcota bacterium]|nr:hypothetical protein [Myxococcota bacterium]
MTQGEPPIPEGCPPDGTPPPPTTPFLRRIWRAAMLDACLYEEVEADRRALPQAALVVLLASLSAGIGTFANGGIAGIGIIVAATFIGWVGWAFVTFLIGVYLIPGPRTESDQGELMRTVGFSASPGLFAGLGIIPGLNPWVLILVGGWLLVAMVIAVRQALDHCGTGRAIAVCAIGFPLSAAALGAAILFTGPWPF